MGKKKQIETRRSQFIHELAIYLVQDQAIQSIKLEMNNPEAKIWQKIRCSTPLFGYPTVEEAEKVLDDWFTKGLQ